MSERASIDAFLALKRIAFVGASTHEDDFSRAVLRELVAHGIDVVPVHPRAAEIAGRRAYATVTAIPGHVDGAFVMTPPATSASVIDDCARAGVRRVWLHRGVGRGSVSDEAVDRALSHGMVLVKGRCPLMFLEEPLSQPHRTHAAMQKLSGTYPFAEGSSLAWHLLATMLWTALVGVGTLLALIAFHVAAPGRYFWTLFVVALFALFHALRHPWFHASLRLHR